MSDYDIDIYIVIHIPKNALFLDILHVKIIHSFNKTLSSTYRT